MRSWLLLLLSFPLSSTFICYTCDGDDCYTPQRWLAMTCPPATQRCYSLSANSKVFRRGCAPFDCHEMSIPRGTQCNPCYTEKCNGELQHAGGGGVWGKAASAPSLLTTGLSIIFVKFF